ncbi:hypothetical protein [Nocardia nova]
MHEIIAFVLGLLTAALAADKPLLSITVTSRRAGDNPPPRT